MYKYIKWLLNKFYTSPKTKTDNNDDSKKIVSEINNGLITFGLDDKDSVLIHCLLPKVDTLDGNIDKITHEAERFSEMLLCLNEGLLKKEIVNVLKKQYEIEENTDQKLLIENILQFWSMLYSHYKRGKKKAAKEANKTPLVRPMFVFSSKK
jgi:hypothetical protein